MEGKAHAYVFASKGTKKWDTCAPEAILTAAGGILTDMNGNSYDYSQDAVHENLRGVLATPQRVDHRELLNKIPQEVRDALTNKK